VLTMTDLFTKWIVARPIPNKTSSAVAEVLVDTFYTFGPPRRIISDQGREFVSQVNIM
jgi:IS30 family transposase